MTYHTNHCWCNESNWDNESFDGEVMVYFGEIIGTDSICKYENKIKDPDFVNLTDNLKFFDEKYFDKEFDRYKKTFEKFAKEYSSNKIITAEIIEDLKENSKKTTVILKPEIINWLNQNIKDEKPLDGEQLSLAERKGWCTGSNKYNSNESWEISLFFKRQVDALKFIREFSIFKSPTFYFDYFHDERREMKAENIINISNNYFGTEVDINKIKLKDNDTSNILDPKTFIILDWDIDGDDIRLTNEELIELSKMLRFKQ